MRADLLMAVVFALTALFHAIAAVGGCLTAPFSAALMGVAAGLFAGRAFSRRGRGD